jgi:uncharacterized protein YbjT (DUF2867 family)
MSSIVVFGATGTIGSRIVREALNRGHQVTAVVRDPARSPKRTPTSPPGPATSSTPHRSPRRSKGTMS